MIAIAACVNHPEREALGVCVRCRTRVCSECVTKVDGINYCVTCLAIMAVEASAPPVNRADDGRWLGLRLGFSVVILIALTWVLLDMMLPGVS